MLITYDEKTHELKFEVMQKDDGIPIGMIAQQIIADGGDVAICDTHVKIRVFRDSEDREKP